MFLLFLSLCGGQDVNWLRKQPLFLEGVKEISKLLLFPQKYERATSTSTQLSGGQPTSPWLTNSLIDNPTLLTATEFFSAGKLLESPLSIRAKLPPDAALTVLQIAKWAADTPPIRRTLVSALAYIKRTFFKPFDRILHANKCANSLQIAPKICIASMEGLIMGMQWLDNSMSTGFLVGFNPVYELFDSGVWRIKERLASFTPTCQENSDWTCRLERMTRTRGAKGLAGSEQHALAQACWAKTLSEREKGYTNGPFTRTEMDTKFGWGKWRPIGRSAICQNGGFRCVDDARTSKHNDMSAMHETIVCSGPDFPAISAAAFQEAFGRCVAMRLGTADIEAAYRRIPNSNLGFTVVTVWDPISRTACYFTVPGFNFGLASAVVCFNRFPALVVAACRVIFGTNVCNFFDDFSIAEPAMCGNSGHMCLSAMMDFLGGSLSPDKHVGMAACNPYLGVVTDFSHILHTGFTLLRMKDGRGDSIIQSLQSYIQAGKMSRADASRIRGRLQYLGCSTFGRLGRAPLQALVQHQYKTGNDNSIFGDLLDALIFLVQLIRLLPARRVAVDPSKSKKPLLIWSDAMWEPKEVSRVRKSAARTLGADAQIGFVIYDPVDNELFHGFKIIGQDIIDSFVPGKQTYIGQLEALAAAAAYDSLNLMDKSRLVDRLVLHWVDNTSAIAGLVKGYSPKSDTGRIINSLQVRLSVLMCSPWFAYVPSAQNIADAPSRGDFELLNSMGSTPIECTVPAFETWESPLKSLKKSHKRSKHKRATTSLSSR